MATRRKMSAARTGRPFSTKARRAIAAGNRRKAFDSVFRAKLSNALKGRPKSPEHLESLRRIWRSKKYREKIRASLRGRIFTSEHLNNLRIAHRTPEYRGKQLVIHLGSKRSAATCRRISQLARKRFREDAAYRRRNLEALSHARMAARKVHPTSIERKVHGVLDELGVVYITEYRMGPYLIDAFVPEKNLAIECDGKYWHSTVRGVRGDRRKDQFVRKAGFAILRLQEAEIRGGRFRERLHSLFT